MSASERYPVFGLKFAAPTSAAISRSTPGARPKAARKQSTAQPAPRSACKSHRTWAEAKSSELPVKECRSREAGEETCSCGSHTGPKFASRALLETHSPKRRDGGSPIELKRRFS